MSSILTKHKHRSHLKKILKRKIEYVFYGGGFWYFINFLKLISGGYLTIFLISHENLVKTILVLPEVYQYLLF